MTFSDFAVLVAAMIIGSFVSLLIDRVAFRGRPSNREVHRAMLTIQRHIDAVNEDARRRNRSGANPKFGSLVSLSISASDPRTE